MLKAFQASWVIVGDGHSDAIRDGAVVVDEVAAIVAVGAASDLRAQFPSASWSTHRGVLLPGLVNAYARLEHALVEERVAGGAGFVPFFAELSAKFSPWMALEMDDAPIRAAVLELARLGTSAVGDVTASGATMPILLRSRLASRIFREVAGMSADAARMVDSFAREQLDELSPIELERVSLVPHSLLGTHRDFVRSLAAEARETKSLFALPLATSAAERAFLLSKDGPFAEFARSRGMDLGDDPSLGSASVEAALALDALHEGTLATQLVDATRDEIAALARSGASVVVMPRAALHVEVRLPDVPAMLADGLSPALGTDSVLASGDLDVLAEAKTLRARFPGIAPRLLIAMATSFGARALHKDALGELAPGKTPGVLLIEGEVAGDPEAWVLGDLRRSRRFLANPSAV
jgi:cytosine/adenosine deaminase-related metal-dependent hydrolase